MAMADVRKHATNEGLQCMEKMEEGLKKLEEEARTRQEEVRAKGTEEQDVRMRLDEEVGRKATERGQGQREWRKRRTCKEEEKSGQKERRG